MTSQRKGKLCFCLKYIYLYSIQVGEGSGGEQEPSSSKNQIILSPINPNLLNVEDIDADNLAADFDGSFTGFPIDRYIDKWFGRPYENLEYGHFLRFVFSDITSVFDVSKSWGLIISGL